MKVDIDAQKAKEAIEKAKLIREQHRRACLLLGTTVIVLGAWLGIVTGMHGASLVVEAVGLYMVAMV